MKTFNEFITEAAAPRRKNYKIDSDLSFKMRDDFVDAKGFGILVKHRGFKEEHHFVKFKDADKVDLKVREEAATKYAKSLIEE